MCRLIGQPTKDVRFGPWRVAATDRGNVGTPTEGLDDSLDVFILKRIPYSVTVVATSSQLREGAPVHRGGRRARPIRIIFQKTTRREREELVHVLRRNTRGMRKQEKWGGALSVLVQDAERLENEARCFSKFF